MNYISIYQLLANLTNLSMFAVCMKHRGTTATLQDLHLDYECECRQGFEGDNCEIELDGCIGQVCQNNGTCFVSINVHLYFHWC